MGTFCFIAEQSPLHKILELLLKDYLGPHKACLGATCNSQSSPGENHCSKL